MSRWKLEEVQYLKDNYGVITSSEIGLYLEKSAKAVQLKAMKMGIKVEKKYSFNENYFEEINSHDKAYWLGFIYADGYVVYKEETRNYELGITLKREDDAHLKKFNSSIDGNFKINYRTRKVKFAQYEEFREYEQVEIRVYSKKIVTDLIKLGIVPKKSYAEFSLPKISGELKWSFIRGYLDGDGHITISERTNSRSAIGFTSINKDFLEELKEYLSSNYNINSSLYINGNTNETSYQLSIRENSSKIIFLNKCYENQDVFLDRKFKRHILLKDALLLGNK